jgi:FkbM family methyltransferase
LLLRQWPSDIPFDRIVNSISKEPVILEAGVGKGIHTVAFAEAFPQARIFGFEPIIELYREAESRCNKYPNIKLFNLAIFDTNSDKVELYWSEREAHESASVLEPNDFMKDYFPQIRFESTRTVEGITLDTFVKSEGITTIDLLWLDLQGAELRILTHGANHTLEITQSVHIEVARKQVYHGASLIQEVTEFFSSKGFSIREKEMGLVFGNILFVRNRVT